MPVPCRNGGVEHNLPTRSRVQLIRGQSTAARAASMRPATVEAYARDAGFEDFAIAPIENDFWRFYLMRGWRFYLMRA